jgi:ABC-type thiamine transport system ATPase subunit
LRQPRRPKLTPSSVACRKAITPGSVLGESHYQAANANALRSRAFLKNAPILVLDEPASALDLKTEEEILQSLDRLMRGRTTLLIAHRPSLLRGVARVLTLEEGQLSDVAVSY